MQNVCQQFKMGQSISMTPYQRFQVIFEKWFPFTSNSIGLNILDKSYKTYYSFFIAAFAISVMTFSLYTMIAFDMEMCLKATAFSSLALQACIKVYTYVIYRSEFLFMTSFIEKIYMVNEKESSKKTKEIMEKCSSYNFFITAALYALYIFATSAYFCYPILVFVIFRTKEPLLPIYLPGIDINTNEGFVVTSIYHCAILYVSGIGWGFIDGLFSNLVFNVFTMAELQCNQLSTLNEEITDAKPRISKIRSRWTNFLLMNQEMQQYVKLINDTYFLMIFVQVMTNAVCITFIFFMIMTMTWYPAYFLVPCLNFQMSMFCALGTVVEIANDKLEHAMLQMDFYLLPLDLQRDFLFMINVVQKARCVKSATLNIDVKLLVAIMNKIYSVIVLLRKVL